VNGIGTPSRILFSQCRPGVLIAEQIYCRPIYPFAAAGLQPNDEHQGGADCGLQFLQLRWSLAGLQHKRRGLSVSGLRSLLLQQSVQPTQVVGREQAGRERQVPCRTPHHQRRNRGSR
jgi:hypothetical protein